MPLTKKQYIALADKLRGTTGNVYTIAGSLYGCNWEDVDFDKLEAATGLFRCEECSGWKDKSEKDRAVAGFCTPCVDKMNGVEDDD